mmetsp:Transcript_30038/g.44514  ORF Transcript_30038/g.44514 Transcript_30038/m.44514 type:complete len:469 (+) Transcript_30038:78-1484(+)|eukprot:CAMPEP_0195525036 /NCGR_PEP_ID=MMETSP0794_2-20130614/25222_1 /TAXON_ID=515487 /ORGANISM="Stephanopyxis turris, Strain CCMP 815" /LENGTH=468 /DNA_ID=CAMNT_0040655387 /DNA_START=78 /DNA_END=1484 /DNA_ORIENTATION=+
MKITAAMLLLASTAGIADARSNRFKIPLPTAAQLKYQEQEIVALTHFNMATFFRDGDPACDNINWAKSQQPASFAPTNLNVSNWIEHYKAVGAKSGILTAKHGCGFLLWPTNVTLPNGDNYGYHIGGEGGLGIDLAAEFSEKMQEAGLPHSFYYSLKDSFYLNAIGDAVKPPSTLLPGQVNVTQDQFEDISVAAVTELWSRYGDLAEIWFDGGISDHIHDRIVPLLQKLQPNAVTMGAGIANDPNEVDWVGTETGMPTYPVWSTGCVGTSGAGNTGESPETATNFCPKCGDCTLQSPDVWFWEPNIPIKSLDTLKDMYHGTVGQNGVMELDFAVDRTGNIDPTHSKRYFEFGDWIRACYGTPVATTGPSFEQTTVLNLTLTSDPAGVNIDRVVVMEDLSQGQVITQYSVEALLSGADAYTPFVNGTAVGHKHINIASAAIKATALRLTVDASVAPPSVSLAAFAPDNC